MTPHSVFLPATGKHALSVGLPGRGMYPEGPAGILVAFCESEVSITKPGRALPR